MDHKRLASAARGDDVTFSRYVKTGKAKVAGKPRRLKPHGRENAAAREGRSYFRKSVKAPRDTKNLLVSGYSNIKIGRDARIGKLKGYWIYTLSLEERATCPRSCSHWQTCYGNNMPYAKRIDHRAADFLPRLEAELNELCVPKRAARGGRALRKGVIVRLHALGDFYSTEYAFFWARMLRKHPKLVVFGYTAWGVDTLIGRTVYDLIDEFPGRWMLRFSNGQMTTRSTVPILDVADCPPGAFVCPEQTGQFEACGKCGACWATLKNVAFLQH